MCIFFFMLMQQIFFLQSSEVTVCVELGASLPCSQAPCRVSLVAHFCSSSCLLKTRLLLNVLNLTFDINIDIALAKCFIDKNYFNCK